MDCRIKSGNDEWWAPEQRRSSLGVTRRAPQSDVK
jgi:hypothetical protein